ncbi:cytidine deaminase [Bacillaceae bacterium SIJ1]|uniref:cytidine deaminase n=1 Tax=Litoribacterium kuwaitense TaxID=1398745 RepID=UPI0013EC8FF8|nr:cytidine deaminase [Litoribacterium kuwaitense]NGP45072.1 cytidine deaminase [Litoribacterium kuwaitense]
MIKERPLTEADEQLVRAAEEVIEKQYRFGKHHIGAAVRTSNGDIFTAVHLEANVGRIAVCAEAVVIGKAISEGAHEFDAIVAVAHPHPHEDIDHCWVVAPCGMCRELISDYGDNIDVILPYKGNVKKCNVMELLPEKYGSSD